MQKQGIVIQRLHDTVVIRAEKESSCGSCAGKASCGTLGSWDMANKAKNQLDITLPNSLNAQVGDIVTIEIPDLLILKASMMFYGLPVLAFLLAGGLSFTLAAQLGLSADLFSAIGGLLGASVAWLQLMRSSQTLQMPNMVAVFRHHTTC